MFCQIDMRWTENEARLRAFHDPDAKSKRKECLILLEKTPASGGGNWGIESSCLKIWTDMERLPVPPKDYWSELSHKQIFWYKDSVKKSSVNRSFESNNSHITRPWKRLRWSEFFLASVNIQSFPAWRISNLSCPLKLVQICCNRRCKKKLFDKHTTPER